MRVADIRLAGRATQGVRLIDLKKRNDIISSVCQVPTSTEEEDEEIEQVLNEEMDMVSEDTNETPSVVDADSQEATDDRDNGGNLSDN